MIAPLLAPLLALALQAAAPTPPPPINPVDPITVEAPRAAPKLVSSYPAAGSEPPYGVLVLTLAFDQPMDPAHAPKSLGGPEAPACMPDWRLLPDRRTFVRLCSLDAGKPFRVALEAGAFRSGQAKPLPAVEIAFTSDAEKIDASLADALKSAGRKPEEGPVVDWRAPPGRAAAAGQ